jgi:molybdopterin converting factor small subunit
MKIRIQAFGIAKDILAGQTAHIETDEGVNAGELRKQLMDQFPDFQLLASLKLAVNADYVSDDYVLKENDEVVIIPPVSGG